MNTLDDIEIFRSGPDARAFTQNWLSERKNGFPGSSASIDLWLWCQKNPFHALGIVLNLIECCPDDERLQEAIAMGPATEIVELSDVSFTPILLEAIIRYPKFALYTQWLRENSSDECWTRLRGRVI